ncbi:MAG: hypothetical protein K2X67_04910 [Burkholderiales bacterium]|nr:hypothetical protein [Burkholderiales bacterium]
MTTDGLTRTRPIMQLRRYLALLIPVVLLAGCDTRERATRNEIYQLAYRKAQLQAALEVCDPKAPTTQEHAEAWQEVFESADGWLGITAAGIANRKAAALEEPIDVPESACPTVRKAMKASLAEATRWSARVAGKELCGWVSCD